MRIAYIVSRFPHVPETFIVREMNELDRLGIDIVLCPLIRNREEVIHPSAEPWLQRASFTPFVSLSLVRDTVWWFWRSPWNAARAILVPLLRVARTPNFLFGTLGISLKTFSLARRLQSADVTHVHAHFATHPATAAWMIRRLTGIRYSFTAHAHDIYVHTALLREKVRDAEFVVAVSDYNRRLLQTYGGGDKVQVIHCGVDLTAYVPRRKRDDGMFTIASVASLQPYKGLEYLIRACGVLRYRGSPTFRCEVAGSGELARSLRRLISELELETLVHLLGAQTEEGVRDLLGRADVFVLPSVVTKSGKMEGLPVSIMEALALEIPVIATSVSGISEIVKPGVTGLLVPPRDPLALADAIEAVTKDPKGSAEMAREGRRLVESEFSLVDNVRALARQFAASMRDQVQENL